MDKSLPTLSLFMEPVIRTLRRTKPWLSLVFFLVSSNLLTQALESTSDMEEELRSASTVVVAESSDPVLTPYWSPLVFAEGETLVVDCGVYTGGQPQDFGMTWTGPGGKPIDQARGKTTRKDKQKKDAVTPGAYSVLVLDLKGLVPSDSGLYTCTVDRASTPDNGTNTATFTLTVKDAKNRCGFEDSMCGWVIGADRGATWHVHTGHDMAIVNRTKQGALFDHTYGSSKHIGHFLDVDPRHQQHVDKNATARLTSPTYPKHTHVKCLQFWYIFEGRDRGSLRVALHNASDQDHLQQDLWNTSEDRGPEWQLVSVSVPPQSQDYHIMIEADMCVDTCRLAATSIDDVSLTNGKCSDVPEWPKNELKLRLMGGSSPKEGRLEVLHDGQWGSICSREFGINEAKVVCSALGYGDSLEYAQKCRDAHFGQSPAGSMIWLERLACSKSKERDLASCIIAGETWGETECSHEQDAGVICSDVPVECTTTIAPPPIKPAVITATPAAVPTVPTTTTTKPKIAPTPAVITATTSTEGKATVKKSTPMAPTVHNSEQNKTVPSPRSKTQIPSVIPKVTPPTNTTLAVHIEPTVPAATTTKSAPPTLPTIPSKGSATETTTKTTPSLVKTSTTVKNMKQRTTKPPESKSKPNIDAPIAVTSPITNTTATHFVVPTKQTTSKSPTTKPTDPTQRTSPDVVSIQNELPPALEQYSPGNNAGVAIGIIFGLLIAASALIIVLYRRKRKGKKSTYITFGNPSYSREHLPANDFSLESPLTLSSNGYTVLA